MRATHADWAAYFEAHPYIEAERVATGEWDTAKKHRVLMEQYDRAIAILREYLNAL